MTRNRDNNFFEELHVSSTNFVVSVSWNFVSVGIALMIESNDANDIIHYSFDGSTVHGSMHATFPSEAIIFDNRSQCQVWFKRASGSTPVLVRVEAWR